MTSKQPRNLTDSGHSGKPKKQEPVMTEEPVQIRDSAGQVIAQVEHIDEVTQEAEKWSTKWSSEVYATYFERSADGIVVMRLDGRCEIANPAICRMLDCDTADLLEMGFLNRFAAEEADRISRDIAQAANSQIKNKSCHMTTLKGAAIQAQISIKPIGQDKALVIISH